MFYLGPMFHVGSMRAVCIRLLEIYTSLINCSVNLKTSCVRIELKFPFPQFTQRYFERFEVRASMGKFSKIPASESGKRARFS